MNKDIDALNVLVGLATDSLKTHGYKTVRFRTESLKPVELGVIIQESLEKKDKIILELRRYFDNQKQIYETSQYIRHGDSLSENSKYLGLLKDNHIIRKRLDELLESE
jgi:hypothetical protein